MTWAPNPGQVKLSELLTGPQRHTCGVGGSRSGKTSQFVETIFWRGLKAPESRHVMLRQHANAARTSLTLDTIPKIARLCFPGMVLEPHKQDGYFTLPSGSEIWVGGLDDQERVDKILGREYATIFLNESSQIAFQSVLTARTRLAQVAKLRDGKGTLSQREYCDLNPVGKGHWTNVVYGELRDPISHKPLPDPHNYKRLFLNPKDNAPNLTPEYLQSLELLPLRQRKRFWEGEYVDEMEGALWSYEGIERGRVEEGDIPVDRRRRVVVAVDPSGAASASDENRDEIGIVVAALGVDGHAYVLADRSMREKPAIWAKAVVAAYHEFEADSIIAEINYGGEMVRFTIQATDANVPVKVITASRGKVVRADPVATLYGDPPDYDNIRVHHVGYFPTLEDQLCAFTTAGYLGEGSPDHADALVWAITELKLADNAEAWITYAAQQAAAANAEQVATPKRARPAAPPEASTEIEGNTINKAYHRVTRPVLAKQDKCAWCGVEVGSSRTSDGEHVYHAECYPVFLRAGRKTTEKA